MSAIVPAPRCAVSFRLATMDDLPKLDALQKQFNKALGYFPTKQLQGYVEMGGVLIAEEPPPSPSPASGGGLGRGKCLGYVISRDRYLKRDELGVIFQLCVAPGEQRKLVGAALVREVFARSAYGCKLYCLWCAQDLEANHFWESMGFVPIAFRAGSQKKGRVHIFWERRIREGDATTPYWFPSQTQSGAIREDRLVFPIPPSVHWKDVNAVAPTNGSTKHQASSIKQIENPKHQIPNKPASRRRVQIGVPTSSPPVVPVKKEKPAKKPKTKVDPKLVAAARELRDRYLEHVNTNEGALLASGKYDVSRQLAGPPLAGSFPTRTSASSVESPRVRGH